MTPEALLNHCRGAILHQRDLERATGEHFNLFQILGLGHYEVVTHSPLLGDLLNPNGTHGQGSIFLKHFKAMLKTLPRDKREDDLNEFDEKTAKVALEFSLGKRTETDGGRLDILITDAAGREIAIENKIHAREQSNWVMRYRNGIQSKAPLIYLTLNGDEPEEVKGSSANDVLCVSYKTNIIEWLKSCRKEASTVPVVRESLTQYIHLIQRLTHQNTSSRMNNEIITAVLQNPESLSAFGVLRDADSAVRGRIVQNLVERIRPKLPSEFPMDSEPDCKGDKRESFTFSTTELLKHKFRAVISFDSQNYGNCFYGFETIDGSQVGETASPAAEKLLHEFQRICPGAKKSGIWPAWIYWESRRNWDDEVLKLIEFGNGEFDNELLEVIKNLRNTARLFAESMATPQ